MEYSAIFHDMDKRFSYAVDKDLFVIRVQVKKDDMKEVILHYEDKYIPMERKDTRKTVPMKKVAVSQFHDYYEAQIKMHLICLRYFFEFTDTQGEKVYYGNYEFDKECITNRDRMFDCPQNLREEEMFEVPEWAANKVVYQIFPSRFAATEPVDKELWYKAPITPMDDLHGNLRGIIEHMDDIKNLGIDVLYMTPIFQSNSCHKYDTTDYYQIDPSFGTTEDLKELVQKAHERGMKVVLDAVYNHTGREFFAFADILENGEKSAQSRAGIPRAFGISLVFLGRVWYTVPTCYLGKDLNHHHVRLSPALCHDRHLHLPVLCRKPIPRVLSRQAGAFLPRFFRPLRAVRHRDHLRHCACHRRVSPFFVADPAHGTGKRHRAGVIQPASAAHVVHGAVFHRHALSPGGRHLHPDVL